MSLLIAIAKDRETGEFGFDFDSKTNAHTPLTHWIGRSDFAHLVGFGYYRWELNINPTEDQIVCGVYTERGLTPCFQKCFPLREGVVAVSDLTDYDETFPRLNKAQASFRTPEFQKFLDDYGIFAFKHHKIDILYGANGSEYDPNAQVVLGQIGNHNLSWTTAMRSDASRMEYDEEYRIYRFENASWVLERWCRFDQTGRLLSAGDTLHTMIRDLDRLRESFAEHGIFPDSK